MRILGLCNGQLGGNSEILLKAALTEARAVDPSIQVEWIHVPSVVIPRNPAPLKGTIDVSMGTNKGHMSGLESSDNDLSIDDRQTFLNAIMDADAIIVSSATYSHQPPGFLKAVMDRVGGPFLDASFVTTAVEKKKKGDPAFANFQFDPRLLKPRVLGFMMTGGSTTPDQYSQALPSLHLYFYCLHAKVVDQFIGKNFMDAGSVLLDPDILERARLLARNVLSQLGKSFDDAKFLGQEDRGACPYCHLTKFELLPNDRNAIGCTSCGARGRLVITDDGQILPAWEEDSPWSCITMRGKMQHCDDIMTWGQRERHRMSSVQEAKKQWLETELPMVELPSRSRLQNQSSSSTKQIQLPIHAQPLEQAKSSHGEPPGHPTEGFMLNHCMLRIRSPSASLHFYVELMGMRPVFIRNVGPMTIHYLGYPETAAHRSDPEKYARETNPLLGSTRGLLELVYMHGSEQAGYTYVSGSEPPHLGFGHVGFTVPDVEAAIGRLRSAGVEVVKEMSDVSRQAAGITEWETKQGVAVEELSPQFCSIMSKIAFVKDPDGYFVELVPRHIHSKPPAHNGNNEIPQHQ